MKKISQFVLAVLIGLGWVAAVQAETCLRFCDTNPLVEAGETCWLWCDTARPVEADSARYTGSSDADLDPEVVVYHHHDPNPEHYPSWEDIAPTDGALVKAFRLGSGTEPPSANVAR